MPFTLENTWGIAAFIIMLVLINICKHCCKEEETRGDYTGMSFTGLVMFILIILLICVCAMCCKEKQTSAEYTTPVVVTSATHTAPGGYPTGMQTVAVYPPAQATAYQQNVYPQQPPYPVSGPPSAMPMPQMHNQTQPNPIGMNPQMMPPYPMAGPSMNPPSYESAVGQNAYEKQSPYNPGYAAGH